MASPLGKRVLDYFDLRSPARDLRSAPGPATALAAAGTEVVPPAPEGSLPTFVWQRDLWPLLLYASNMFGVLAKQWYDGYQRGIAFDVHPSTFILAVVVSAVTYPVTYHTLQAESRRGMQLFLALQNGFFWQSVLGGIMR